MMITCTHPVCALAIVLLAAAAPSAQNSPARDRQLPMPISLTTEADRVRFTTPGHALEWRLEVTSPQGDPIFDSAVVNDKTLDWPLVDFRGQPIESGIYRYTLTIGADNANARVHRGQLQIERMLNLYRIDAIGHDVTGSSVALTVLEATQGPASESTPAARAGNGGPQAAPVIPAAEPFRRSLSSVSFSPQPLISGSGQTHHMTKWLDGPSGVVGDTNVTEVNAAVVIGNGTFRGNLHIFGSALDDVFAGMGPNLITGPGFNYGYAGSSFGRSAGFFNVRPDISAVAPNPSLRFMTANIERMIVTNLGNVGIGISTPEAKLEVGGITSSHIFMTSYDGTTPTLLGRTAEGSVASPSPVLNGDRLLFLGGSGYAPSGFGGSAGVIDVRATEDWTATAQGGEIRFLTNPNGSTALTERMRINHNGTVGIGTTAALSEKLHVFGNIRVGTAGTNGCVQRFDGGAIAGACASDRRFKRDITPFPNLLDKVAQLRPVHYYWRSSEFPERQFGSTQSYGLIAQEVERIFPDLVTSDVHGYKQVDYAKLPLLTLQAIKELKAENDALKQRLVALEVALNTGKKQ